MFKPLSIQQRMKLRNHIKRYRIRGTTFRFCRYWAYVGHWKGRYDACLMYGCVKIEGICVKIEGRFNYTTLYMMPMKPYIRDQITNTLTIEVPYGILHL